VRTTPWVSQVTRAEVRAQTPAAIASGELRELNGDINAFQIAQRGTPAPVVMAGK